MNNLEIFENEEFGSIRTMLIDEAVWFVGKDVAIALGYINTKDAISSHIDEEDRQILQRSENATFNAPNRGMTIINESGLYSLILSSKLPTAKKFKRWVTSEVLPSIRKQGHYIAPIEGDTAFPKVLPDSKDYLQAARLIAHCPQKRLKMVCDLLEKGGFDLSMNKPGRYEMFEIDTSDMSARIDEVMRKTGMGVYRLAETIGVNGNTLRAYHAKDRFPRPARYEEIVLKLNAL